MEDKNKIPKAKRKNNKPIRERNPIITTENILKWKTGFFGRLVYLVIVVLVLLANFNFAFDYTVEAYRDGAYKYSDEAYKYIEASIKNYLGDDGPDIKKLQECFPAEKNGEYHIDYKDGYSIIECSLQDGFFVPTVTVKISQDFKLIGVNGEIIELAEENPEEEGSEVIPVDDSLKEIPEEATSETTETGSSLVSEEETSKGHTGFRRNFNSMQEYQDYFWRTIKISTFKLALLWSLIALSILIVFDCVLTRCFSKSIEKKAGKPLTSGEVSSSASVSTITEKEDNKPESNT